MEKRGVIKRDSHMKYLAGAWKPRRIIFNAGVYADHG